VPRLRMAAMNRNFKILSTMKDMVIGLDGHEFNDLLAQYWLDKDIPYPQFNVTFTAVVMTDPMMLNPPKDLNPTTLRFYPARRSGHEMI